MEFGNSAAVGESFARERRLFSPSQLIYWTPFEKEKQAASGQASWSGTGQSVTIQFSSSAIAPVYPCTEGAKSHDFGPKSLKGN